MQMKPFQTIVLGLSLPLIAIFISVNANAADKLPADTRYLNDQELFKIYSNRTWMWSAGGGYFENRQRKFSAFSNENAAPSIATGMWFLPWQGKVCFRARWQGVDYNVKKTSCFGHRITPQGVIWQRREPDGEWYVFRNVPGKSTDGIRQLRLGNRVKTGLLRNQQALAK